MNESVRVGKLAAGIAALTIVASLLLIFNLPNFSAIPYWMWPYQPAAWQGGVIAWLGIAVPATLFFPVSRSVGCAREGSVWVWVC